MERSNWYRLLSRRRRCSGVGNAFLDSERIVYYAWNTSSLLHFSSAVLTRRLQRLRSITQANAIIAVQETHGDGKAVRE
eukprot:4421909-Pyramimonas_sp.AAC.1